MESVKKLNGGGVTRLFIGTKTNNIGYLSFRKAGLNKAILNVCDETSKKKRTVTTEVVA